MCTYSFTPIQAECSKGVQSFRRSQSIMRKLRFLATLSDQGQTLPIE